MRIRHLITAVFALALIAVLLIRGRKGNESIRGRLVSIGQMDTGLTSTGKKSNGQNTKGLMSGLSGKFDEAMYSAGIKANTSKYSLVWMASVVGLPLILSVFGVRIAVSLGTAVILAGAPFLLMGFLRKRRAIQFEAQLADAIEIMNSAIRAGYSFQSSLQVVARSSQDPIRSEFSTVFNEMQLGVPMENALRNLSQRIRSKDVEIFCTALIVQTSIGGNLVMVLSNISQTIRTRISIRKEIRAKTSSGKASGLIVGALPFLLMLVLKMMNPEYLQPLFTEPLGRTMLLAGVGLMAAGILIIRKIVNVEY